MTRRAGLLARCRGGPAELRDFDFDPIGNVLADRGAYVAAALTVIAPTAWQARRLSAAPSDPMRIGRTWCALPSSGRPRRSGREHGDGPRGRSQLSAIRELFEHWREHLHLSSGYTTNTIIRTACDREAASSFRPWRLQAGRVSRPSLAAGGDGGAVNQPTPRQVVVADQGPRRGRLRIEMKEDGSHGNRFLALAASAGPTISPVRAPQVAPPIVSTGVLTMRTLKMGVFRGIGGFFHPNAAKLSVNLVPERKRVHGHAHMTVYV